MGVGIREEMGTTLITIIPLRFTATFFIPILAISHDGVRVLASKGTQGGKHFHQGTQQVHCTENQTPTCTLCALCASESTSREEGRVLAPGIVPKNHGEIGITSK